MSSRALSAKNISDKFRTWVELDRAAARHNYLLFRRRVPRGPKLFAVVKSNAYGHGLPLFPALLDRFGVDGFCVDSIVEGFRLRREGIKKPILVLGLTLPFHLARAHADGITITASSFDTLKQIAAGKDGLAFHVKVDTGMHRQGFYPEDIGRVLKFIRAKKLEKRFTGIYTHFASAKDVTYPGYTETQFARFQGVLRRVAGAKFKVLRHASATGGTMLDKKYHLDAVRIGMGLYGYAPSKELEIQRPEFDLKPVLSWRTVVGEIKPVKRGDYVGYDCAERMTRSGTLAVLPVGYWHGYPRSLSHVGEVLIRGRRAKVVGRVSMDLLIVDVTGIGAKFGDAATLIGRDGRDEITASEIAERAGTSHYEFLTRINPLIERVAI